MGVLGIVDTAGKLTQGISGRYEVKRGHQWTMTFDFTNVANTASDRPGFQNSLQIQLSKSARPNLTIKELTVYRANERYFLAGRPEQTDLAVTFNDAISAPPGTNSDDGEAPKSASGVLYAWYTSIYDPVTGAMSLAKSYKAKATLVLYDPTGAVIEKWLYVGIFPTDIKFSDLDYSAESIATVDVTFKWDKCYKIATSSTTEPQTATTSSSLPDNGI